MDQLVGDNHPQLYRMTKAANDIQLAAFFIGISMVYVAGAYTCASRRDFLVCEVDNVLYYKCTGVSAMTARTINVRLPEALYNQIEELAKATARSKSFLAIDALTHYVQSESWQIRDIHEGIKEADAGEFATDKQVKAVFAKYGA